jgi:hypothetical protein
VLVVVSGGKSQPSSLADAVVVLVAREPSLDSRC